MRGESPTAVIVTAYDLAPAVVIRRSEQVPDNRLRDATQTKHKSALCHIYVA